MSHVRQQLVDAVITRLTGLATTGSHVFADRPEDYELAEADLPALRVYDDGEATVQELVLSPRTVLRTISIRVDAVAKSASGLAATLRTICSEVETALGTTVSVGGIAVDVVYTRTDPPERDAQSDRPVSRVSMVFEAQLATAAAAPEVLLSY